MLEHMVWDETERWQKPLKLQTRTPREAPSAGSGEWDHKQALYPVPRPAHTQPKPLPNRPWSRRPGGCRGALCSFSALCVFIPFGAKVV